MLKNKITIFWTSVHRVCGTALNIFPHWISKPYIRKHKNHSKASSGAGRFSQNLHACKKSQFIVHNYKSGRHNQRHTFRSCKSQDKTTSIDILYTGLKVKGKGRKNGKTKTPSPRRRNQTLCAINLCQDATVCGSTKIKPLFLFFDEPNLCNDYLLRDSEYIDFFVLIFLITVFSTKFIRIPIC